MSYILHFIDSVRFMASLLSNLASNLSKEIHKIKCKHGHEDKKVKLVELHRSICKFKKRFNRMQMFTL